MTDDELAGLITQGGVVARPGDTLVVALHDNQISHESAARLRAELLEQLPDGARVAIVAGAAGLAVYRAEP